MRAKYPIINGMKVCASCLADKPIGDFNRVGEDIPYVRNQCKPCHSKSAYMSALNNKLKRNPGLYWRCGNDLCNWVNPNKEKRCLKCEL